MRMQYKYVRHMAVFTANAQVNWWELFVKNLWRENSYRIWIRSKYEPGLQNIVL